MLFSYLISCSRAENYQTLSKFDPTWFLVRASVNNDCGNITIMQLPMEIIKSYFQNGWRKRITSWA